ncbi:hypothetical protein AOA57_19855, partial [Pseudomonas sp. 2588-5]
ILYNSTINVLNVDIPFEIITGIIKNWYAAKTAVFKCFCRFFNSECGVAVTNIFFWDDIILDLHNVAEHSFASILKLIIYDY